MERGQLLVGIVYLLFIAFLGAIGGALSMAVTALVVSGGAYLIGFVGMGLAKAIALWMVAGGALIGAVGGSAFALFAGATLG